MGGMKEILLTDEPATGGVFYSINLTNELSIPKI
jgi:hypothetical protein